MTSSTLSRETLEEIVRKAIGEVASDCDPASIAAETDLRANLDLDSVDLLRIVERVHVASGIEIPERDLGRLSTLRSWLDYLTKAS